MIYSNIHFRNVLDTNTLIVDKAREGLRLVKGLWHFPYERRLEIGPSAMARGLGLGV